MPKIVWDEIGKRTYETGVSKGVLYTRSGENTGFKNGVAWNGLTSVAEKPSGAEPTKLYADNIAYLTLTGNEEFGATIEAYTYPDEFAECDGSAELAEGVMIGQQNRKMFGLSYQTILGNDTDGEGYGYKIHLIYNCKASPTEKSYATINDSPEAITFSWEISTTPINVSNHKPTASLIIDSTKITPTALAKIEAKLYGTESAEAELPTPDEIIALIAAG